jgi:3-phenylpropionate/trans-cinnamate dioxygenase ferredoxin reductase subunit
MAVAGKATFVIVGASLAGAKAAETLRTEGFDGRVVLVGEEPVRPYERPPLTKDYLRGESGFDSAAVHKEDFYEQNDIELLTSTRASRLDPGSQQVVLEPGGALHYDQLLLTTGASPRTLSIPGADLEGIHYVRTVAEADALREALGKGGKVVVIGGGWVGSEVTASARQLDNEVTLIDPGHVPLEHVLGAEVGALFVQLHVDHGVDLRLGLGVVGFRGGKRAEAVELSDGSVVGGDVFVVGIGARPRTELAEAAGLELDDGIVVDQYLATSVPGIWAAGDVANAWYRDLGRRIRLEHWSAALNQGPAAAKNMLGRQLPYAKVPFFYSDQYDLGLEYRGFVPTWDQVVYRGDKDRRELIVFWLDHGLVVAGMNVNVWGSGDKIAALVFPPRRVDPKALADPSVDLASLAVGS